LLRLGEYNTGLLARILFFYYELWFLPTKWHSFFLPKGADVAVLGAPRENRYLICFSVS